MDGIRNPRYGYWYSIITRILSRLWHWEFKDKIYYSQSHKLLLETLLTLHDGYAALIWDDRNLTAQEQYDLLNLFGEAIGELKLWCEKVGLEL